MHILLKKPSFVIISLQLLVAACLSEGMINTMRNLKSRSFCRLPKLNIRNCRMQATQSINSNTEENCKNAHTRLLHQLSFDNRNIKTLPVEDIDSNIAKPPNFNDELWESAKKQISRTVANAIFSPAEPTRVENPRLVALSSDALRLLGVQAETAEEIGLLRGQIERYLSGNELIPGSQPAAHCYCGHQFGSFAGQLGDGAAMSLGEVLNSESGQRWELQLKGAGPTTYSRRSDGRKVLRSSIREFLCSEAMAYLGIPTTRSASCVTSDSTVQRDPLYQGEVIDERCTVISRIAPNFFRFGSFEIFREPDADGLGGGPSYGNEPLKRQLLDHILLYYPEITSAKDLTSPEELYLRLFEEVTKRTAELVASWETVGFVHGVLNTDNMSIMGLTIDYGPFGFMEYFDPDFVPNGSDQGGRYRYRNQADVCGWNLRVLADSLRPLLSETEAMLVLEEQYLKVYKSRYNAIMRDKLMLGLGPVSEDSTFSELVEGLFETMAATGADFTYTFDAITLFARELSQSLTTLALTDDAREVCQRSAEDKLISRIVGSSATPDAMSALVARQSSIVKLRLLPKEREKILGLLESNPGALVEMFGGASIGDIEHFLMDEKDRASLVDRLQDQTLSLAFKSKTAEGKANEDRKKWRKWVSRYSERLRLQIESTIAAEDNGREVIEEHLAKMRMSNPTLILRNWVAQSAIDSAEKGDFSRVETLLRMLRDPYNPAFSIFHEDSVEGVEGESLSAEEKTFIRVPPLSASSLICTCSS